MSQIQIVQVGTDGEPRASTEAIALGYKLQHKNVLALLEQYLLQVETFGQVAFETRAGYQGSVVRFAMLNERQATFLIGLMRNSPEVVDFKLRMAHEFWRMGDALANRDRTLLTRRILLEQRVGRSAALASIGSGLMLDRRRALPGINAERDVLRSVMEPGLFPQELDVAIDKTKSRKRGPKTILGYRKMPSPASAKRAA